MKKKEKKKPSLERIEERRRNAGTQPVFLFVLLLLVSCAVVGVSGRGMAYLYMMLPLCVIIFGGWFIVYRIGAESAFFLNAALLLTFGTMIQCMLLREDGRPTSFMVQYALAAIAALVAGFLYKRLRIIANARGVAFLFCVSIVLYVMTLVLGAAVGGGVRNWVRMGNMSFQPSEFNKGIYVLIMAGLLCTKERPGRKRIWACILVTAVNLAFLAMQGEFGTILLILATFLSYIFLFVADIKVFVAIFSLMLAGGGALAALSAAILKIAGDSNGFVVRQVRKIANRFIYWLHPEADAQGAGYQILQGRKALLNSNLFGSDTTTPIVNSTNDMVFPALTERCGLLIAVTICVLFGLLVVRGTRIYFGCDDRYHQGVAAGLSIQLIVQAFIIIGGSIGMFPLTGITLPLISRGGSSLMSIFVFLSVILVISAGGLWNGRRDYAPYEAKLQKARAVNSKRVSALRNRNRSRRRMDDAR